MLFVCVLAVLGCVSAEDVLQGALSSPLKMATLFSSYQVWTSSKERELERFKLFKC